MTKRRSSPNPSAPRKRHASAALSDRSSRTHLDTKATSEPPPGQPSTQSRQSSSDSSSTLTPPPNSSPMPVHDALVPQTVVAQGLDIEPVVSSKKAPTNSEVPEQMTHTASGPSTINTAENNAPEPGPSGTLALRDKTKDNDTNPTILSKSLVPYNNSDRFPLFHNGDVVITSKLDTQHNRTCQLHSVILATHSKTFADFFRDAITKNPQQSWFYFTIEKVGGNIDIVRKPVTSDERPIIHDTLHTGDVKIKTEDIEDEDQPAMVTSKAYGSMGTNIDVLDSHFQVFGTFYNLPPQICATDISNALIHAEGLVKVASRLNCLPLIRPHIGNAFGQYRQKLFLAIKSDPPRWMQLAIALEDASIFTECLIHLVGAYPSGLHPNSPWPTGRRVLPLDIRRLVDKKSKGMDQRCIETERDLLKITIEMGSRGEPVDVENVAHRETWYVVQFFRDFIATHLNAQNNLKNKLAFKALNQGYFYRAIYNGGSAYMDYEEVRKTCMGLMKAPWKELGEDLKTLKEHASSLVADLGANELMIDPDAHKIGYLTCLKVEEVDIPWKRVL